MISAWLEVHMRKLLPTNPGMTGNPIQLGATDTLEVLRDGLEVSGSGLRLLSEVPSVAAFTSWDSSVRGPWGPPQIRLRRGWRRRRKLKTE